MAMAIPLAPNTQVRAPEGEPAYSRCRIYAAAAMFVFMTELNRYTLHTSLWNRRDRPTSNNINRPAYSSTSTNTRPPKKKRQTQNTLPINCIYRFSTKFENIHQVLCTRLLLLYSLHCKYIQDPLVESTTLGNTLVRDPALLSLRPGKGGRDILLRPKVERHLVHGRWVSRRIVRALMFGRYTTVSYIACRMTKQTT